MFYPILPDGKPLYRPLDVPDPLFVRGIDFEVARLLMYRVMLINVLGKRIMQRHAKEYVFNHPEAIKALAQLIYNAYLESESRHLYWHEENHNTPGDPRQEF
jgi:hypothetical protein